jgi:hypothetical protein
MDTINLQVLEDGTITIKTSAISDGNHMSADQLLIEMEKLMGGKMEFKKDPEAKAHDHMHKHGVLHAHNH